MNKHSGNRDRHISLLISSVLILLIGTLHAQCPAPSFGSTQSACGSASVTLSASSNDPSTTHHYWYTSQTGGSGVATTNQYAPMPGKWVSELTATFSSSVTYWVSASCNGVESTSRTPVSFTLLSPGAININPSAQPMICQGTSITLTPANGTNYSWSSSPGGAISGSGAITVSPSVNTTYTLTGTESNCGTTVTSTINVTVYPLVGTPSVPSGPSSRCQGGGSDTYTTSAANATGSPPYTWSLTAAAGSISSSGVVTWNSSFPASGVASGTAVVTVVANNGCGSSPPVSKNVTVYAPPMAYTLNAPTGICPGATVTIYLSGSQTWVSYQLYKDGNASGSAVVGNGSQLPFPGITQAGTYTITATGTGCSSVSMINSVNLTTLSPGSLSASKNPTTPICQGASVQLSAGGGSSYSWTADTGGSWSGSPITVTPSSNTVYTVTGNESNCGTQVTTTISVGVNRLPTAAASNQTVCSGSSWSIPISNPNSVSGTTYTWTAGSPVNITGYSNGSGPTISQMLYSADGLNTGSITYTIAPSSNGCPGPTTTAMVTVKPTPQITNTSAQLHLTVCSGTVLNFTPALSINGTTYSWTSALSGPISPASISSTGSASITDTPVNTGSVSGTVTYHITPAYNSCSGLAADYVVTVNPLPTAPSFSDPGVPVCGARTLTRGSPVDGSTWYWQGINANGQDQSQAAAATTYNVSVPGTNTYYLRALSTSGCWRTTGTQVTINSIPVPPSNAVSTINTCDAKTLTKGTPPTGIGWYWQGTNASGQDYTTSVATAPTFVVTANNTYYLAARSVAGCWSLTSTPIVVTTYPADLAISSYDPVNNVVQATRSIRLLPGFTSTGGTFNSKIAFTAECNDYVNWNEESGFDQNGQTISRSRTYIDGLGNQLQSQSMDYLSGKVWATQPLYDNLNKAAGSTLPAPILESDFLLKKNFVQNTAGQWYSASDFDNPIVNGSAGEVNNPNAIGNQPGTLGWYFSTANNLESQTPTTAFPYSRSYTPAGPNPTTSLSAGSGNYHHMGTGHENKSDRYLFTSSELSHYTSVRHFFVPESLSSPDLVNLYKPISNVPYQFTSSGAATVSTSTPYVVVTSNANTGTPGTLPIGGNIAVISGGLYTFKAKGYKSATQAANLIVTTSTGTNIVWPGPALPTGGSAQEGWTYVTFQVPTGVTSIRVGVLWSQPLINDTFYLSDAVLQADGVTGYKYISTDPDGKQTASFVDADGHTAATATVTSANYTSTPPAFTYDNWSYTYYNSTGQITATVAPNGVIIGNTSQPNFVASYLYDQLGRLISSTSPDEGTSQFVYSTDGKIRFSQNQEQFNASQKRFSYTNYDYLGRLIESGEYTQNTYVFEPGSTLSPAPTSILQTFILDNNGYSGTSNNLEAGACSDVTKIYYDIQASDLPTGDNNHATQTYLYGRVAKTMNNIATTWYSYDEFGRIAWIKQNISGLGPKTIDYTYDYFGNVTQVAYQQNQPIQPDAFYHHYTYDINNRLVSVSTSKDSTNKTLQATYYYYLHGPLKRVELAGNLQGIDYVYNINGSLKSINGVDAATDPGTDGSGAHAGISADVFGESLDYYSNDYAGAGYSAASVSASGLTDSYSGLIKSASWYTPIDYLASKKIYGYTYDNRNQFQNAKWATLTGSSGNYSTTFPTQAYNENIPLNTGYDKNGNILNLTRKDKAGNTIANYTYAYGSANNQLNQVNGGPVPTAYSYNTIGQMTRQVEGSNTMNVIYNAYGLVKEVRDGSNNFIESFAYDDRGDRVQRTVYTSGAAVKKTFYVRDASGNVMAIYDQKLPGGAIQLTELAIYGAGRLGEYKPVPDTYFYELNDHLGNVRAVIGKPHTDTFLATMELANAAIENAQFKNMHPVTYVAANHTPGGSQVARLSNTAIAGPGIVLRVAPGDMITAEVYAYYEGCTDCSSTQPLSTIISAIAAAFGGVSGAPGDPGKIYSAFNSTLAGGTGAAAGSGDNTVPGAHLNMIMLDGNMLPDVTNLPNASTPVTISANWAKQKLTVSIATPIPVPGYVYIYVNNNSSSTTPVYFDDLKVTQLHSPYVAGGDYYPFGLAMDDRQIKVEPYRYGYQGQYAEKDTLANWNAFQLRMYEPRFGRWLSIDPYGQFDSPYVAMGNNPVSGTDPTGGVCCGALVEITLEDGSKAMLFTEGVDIVAKSSMSVGSIALQEIAAKTLSFANGAMSAYNHDITLGAVNVSDVNKQANKDHYRRGETFGHIIAAGQGALEMFQGGMLTFDGGALTLTGPGAIVGVPAIAGGLGLGAHGYSVFDIARNSLSRVHKLNSSRLPSLDKSGKVHGKLPKREDFYKYSLDDLRQLLRELKQSVQMRIKRNSELGVDKAAGDLHGLRQAEEQGLIRDIENYLQGK